MNGTTKIVLIGSGRVAWHLGRRLKEKGLPVAMVISRREEAARGLAGALGAAWATDFSGLMPDADWVIVAVRDDAIPAVAEGLAPYVQNALVTHTSGGVEGKILAPWFGRFGVFYPLQSFSMERAPVWSKIPFCVDASLPEDLLFLKKMAKRIGNVVWQINDEERARLHVAAVFANNFTNHCFAIAEKLLDETRLPFELLYPLMEETLHKALQDSPARMQTGPALRGDLETLRKHLRLLEAHPRWQELYRKISEDINPELDI